MGNGEQAESSAWEAAMAGALYRPENLYSTTNRNDLQSAGLRNSDGAGELHGEVASIRRGMAEADGNDTATLLAYFNNDHPAGKPRCLIAHTVKDKGLPFA
jgi:transketolase